MLPESEYRIEEYDALQINYLHADLDSDDEALCIFTSKHAVEACFPEGRLPDRMLNCCCVGEKTARKLAGMGHRILDVRENAKALAEQIIRKYAGRSFIYFCGNQRLDTLPGMLHEAGVRLEERVVYQTGLREEWFDEEFDAVLFFSPSGVRSFISANQLGDATALCIGPTTAQAVQKYTKEFLIAESPTVEGVLESALKLQPKGHGT